MRVIELRVQEGVSRLASRPNAGEDCRALISRLLGYCAAQRRERACNVSAEARAVTACGQVPLQFGHTRGVECAIEKVRQVGQHVATADTRHDRIESVIVHGALPV